MSLCVCMYVCILYVHVFVSFLCIQIIIREHLPIINFKGSEVGQLTVEALPCLPHGALPEGNEMFLEDPTQLIGQPLHFMLRINQVTGLPKQFSKVRIRM